MDIDPDAAAAPTQEPAATFEVGEPVKAYWHGYLYNAIITEITPEGGHFVFYPEDKAIEELDNDGSIVKKPHAREDDTLAFSVGEKCFRLERPSDLARVVAVRGDIVVIQFEGQSWKQKRYALPSAALGSSLFLNSATTRARPS